MHLPDQLRNLMYSVAESEKVSQAVGRDDIYKTGTGEYKPMVRVKLALAKLFGADLTVRDDMEAQQLFEARTKMTLAPKEDASKE